jgi:hypothetical protein
LDVSATLLDLSRNSDYREVDFFQMILSDEFLEKHVVDPINDRLKESMKRTSKEWERKCKPTNVNKTKRFLIFYFLENFFRKRHIKNNTEKWESLRDGQLSKRRREILLSAFKPSIEHLIGFNKEFSNQIWKVFRGGSVLVVDESTYEYSGSDMREAGIDIYIPRKPHPYGLLDYVGYMKLCYSHLPIVVDCQFRLL